MTGQIRCHYEVLSVPRDADAASIKKRHRRLALQHHPDKNVGKAEEERARSAAEFKLIQAAYECLSDPVERKWYDEHRDLILRGGLEGGADGGDGSTFLYDVMPFQYAGCYDGYDDDDPESFYSVYGEVFDQIFQGEKDGYISEGNIDVEKMANAHLSVGFGNSMSEWADVLDFYNAWEGFTSCLSFAHADMYHLNDIREAPNRRIRRLMEDDNKKKRKAAKRERVEDVCALVRFVKKRDPRVKEQREKNQREQAQKEVEMRRQAAQRKKDVAAAKQEWRAEAERTMAEQEAADLDAGRIRLADLSDDDYDYGGKRGRKKKGKRKGKGKGQKQNGSKVEEDDKRDEASVLGNTDAIDQKAEDKDENDDIDHDKTGKAAEDTNSPNVCVADEECCVKVDDENMLDEGSDSSSSEDVPDFFRCECCRKDFKSQKQYENHERSKKHKETLKKFQKRMQKKVESDALNEMMGAI
ncbi:hypothetical protein ACHAWF_002890 [Thalassiosira exigua]